MTHVYAWDHAIRDAHPLVGATAIQPDPLAAQSSHAALTAWIPVPRLAPDTVLATQIAPNSISALAMGNATPNAQIAHATHGAGHMTHVIQTAIQTMIQLLVAKVAIAVVVELELQFTKIRLHPVVLDRHHRIILKIIIRALVLEAHALLVLFRVIRMSTNTLCLNMMKRVNSEKSPLGHFSICHRGRLLIVGRKM